MDCRVAWLCTEPRSSSYEDKVPPPQSNSGSLVCVPPVTTPTTAAFETTDLSFSRQWLWNRVFSGKTAGTNRISRLTKTLQVIRRTVHLARYFCGFNSVLVGRDNVVGLATRYELDGPGIESRWGPDFSHPSRPAHPASYAMGTGSFPGVKRPRRGADHPPQLAPRLKKE
jgi:hypothetical protein